MLTTIVIILALAAIVGTFAGLAWAAEEHYKDQQTGWDNK